MEFLFRFKEAVGLGKYLLKGGCWSREFFALRRLLVQGSSCLRDVVGLGSCFCLREVAVLWKLMVQGSAFGVGRLLVQRVFASGRLLVQGGLLFYRGCCSRDLNALGRLLVQEGFGFKMVAVLWRLLVQEGCLSRETFALRGFWSWEVLALGRLLVQGSCWSSEVVCLGRLLFQGSCCAREVLAL